MKILRGIYYAPLILMVGALGMACDLAGCWDQQEECLKLLAELSQLVREGRK